MRKKLTAILMCACLCTAFTGQAVFADELEQGYEELTDGAMIESGSVNALVNELTRRTTEGVQKYQEKKEAAETEARQYVAKRQAEEIQAAKETEQEEIAQRLRQEAEEAREAAREAAEKAEKARMAKRHELVDFAVQFQGNPYAWGGTSLTNGADCSGFVMAVFANFGYELPRVAGSQYDASIKKDIGQLEVGDLLFYSSGGGIDHVAIYIGDGQIVHASNARDGIKISEYDYRQPVGVGSYLAVE